MLTRDVSSSVQNAMRPMMGLSVSEFPGVLTGWVGAFLNVSCVALEVESGEMICPCLRT
jgi:hypothetical protein